MLALTLEHAVDLATSDARHGWGCFETVRIRGGQARWLDAHLARLGAGCAFLGLGAPPEAEAVATFLTPHLPVSGALHLTALDGQLLARTGPGPRPLPEPVTLALATSVVRASWSPLHRFKTLSYLENRRLHQEAEALGCFDVVALNEQGRLTDGGRTTLFLVQGDDILTPPEADGALPGIARAVLLAAGLVRESPLTPRDLAEADGVFLANALRGVLPVRRDGRGWVEACAERLR